jgi:hypothetical protein
MQRAVTLPIDIALALSGSHRVTPQAPVQRCHSVAPVAVGRLCCCYEMACWALEPVRACRPPALPAHAGQAAEARESHQAPQPRRLPHADTLLRPARAGPRKWQYHTLRCGHMNMFLPVGRRARVPAYLFAAYTHCKSASALLSQRAMGNWEWNILGYVRTRTHAKCSVCPFAGVPSGSGHMRRLFSICRRGAAESLVMAWWSSRMRFIMDLIKKIILFFFSQRQKSSLDWERSPPTCLLPCFLFFFYLFLLVSIMGWRVPLATE